MSRTILHWQIASPFGVQGWIAGARRLRDYWAGSFLTSWLSACAMRALVDQKVGKVLFPVLDSDPLWRRMTKRDEELTRDERTWFVGTLPNRFKARIDQPELFCPGDDPCTRAAYEAWRRLAKAVWEYFIEPVAGKGKGTREIWERQIAHFWETNWVLGDDPGDGSDGAWLDRRKNWRTHVATQCEPGDHCRIFGDLQELSGWVRARGEGKQQGEFWEKLREQVGKVVGSGKHEGVFELLELRPTERLSAPALVKRLFPCLPAETLKEVFGWIAQGRQRRQGSARPAAIRFWPSTAYVAAVPWMRSAWKEVPKHCENFAREIKKHTHVEAVAEHHSFVPSLEQADAFGAIDGQLLFEDALETEIRNACREGRKQRADGLGEIRQALRDLLGAYRRKVEPQRQGRQVKSFTPSPFYALLLMDGDSIGSLLGKAIQAGAEADVSAALARFGRDVPDMVAHYDGTLIYAGGDDVQAFLPLTEAIPCAVRLHDRYVEAMAPVREKLRKAPRETGQKRQCADELSEEELRDTTTISAALIFAHFHVPLAVVIREAHQLLDDVAKDGNGRDSVAITVRKPSGTAARFVTRFGNHVSELQKLAHKYATDPERSTSFLYDLKDRYGHVLEMFAEKDDDLRRLLLAEWCLGRRPPTDRDREAVDDLLKICRRVPGPKKEKGKEKETESKKKRFDISAALIARFLADQGVGTLELRRDPCQTPATT